MIVTSNVSSSISLGASLPEGCSISCSVSPTSRAVLSGRTLIIAEKSLPLRLRFGSVNKMSFASGKQSQENFSYTYIELYYMYVYVCAANIKIADNHS